MWFASNVQTHWLIYIIKISIFYSSRNYQVLYTALPIDFTHLCNAGPGSLICHCVKGVTDVCLCSRSVDVCVLCRSGGFGAGTVQHDCSWLRWHQKTAALVKSAVLLPPGSPRWSCPAWERRARHISFNALLPFSRGQNSDPPAPASEQLHRVSREHTQMHMCMYTCSHAPPINTVRCIKCIFMCHLCCVKTSTVKSNVY